MPPVNAIASIRPWRRRTRRWSSSPGNEDRQRERRAAVAGRAAASRSRTSPPAMPERPASRSPAPVSAHFLHAPAAALHHVEHGEHVHVAGARGVFQTDCGENPSWCRSNARRRSRRWKNCRPGGNSPASDFDPTSRAPAGDELMRGAVKPYLTTPSARQSAGRRRDGRARESWNETRLEGAHDGRPGMAFSKPSMADR